MNKPATYNIRQTTLNLLRGGDLACSNTTFATQVAKATNEL